MVIAITVIVNKIIIVSPDWVVTDYGRGRQINFCKRGNSLQLANGECVSCAPSTLLSVRPLLLVIQQGQGCHLFLALLCEVSRCGKLLFVSTFRGLERCAGGRGWCLPTRQVIPSLIDPVASDSMILSSSVVPS